jgi:uncharacterized metal-binding protein
MPDGRTHDEITIVTASFLAPLSFGIAFDGEPGRAALFLGSYLTSGLLFSDDLDINSIEYRRWGLLRFLWLPYQKLIPHRSWLSHGLIVGPLLRILYFAGMCTLLLWLALTALSQVLPLDANGALGGLLSAIGRSLIDHPDWVAVAFAGFVLGSVAHIVSDWIWTWWRRAIRGPAISMGPPTVVPPTHHGMATPDFVRQVTDSLSQTIAPPS